MPKAMSVTKTLTGAAGAVLLLSTLPAAAQGTDRERSACMSDAMMLCASAIPDANRIEVCLRRNAAQISPACRLVIAEHDAVPAPAPDATGSLRVRRTDRRAY
jgi:hypothetical protein